MQEMKFFENPEFGKSFTVIMEGKLLFAPGNTTNILAYFYAEFENIS